MQIYIFSTVVDPEYRDIEIAEGIYAGKKVFKVLNEAFVDWLCDVKKHGVSIDYVCAKWCRRMGRNT